MSHANIKKDQASLKQLRYTYDTEEVNFSIRVYLEIFIIHILGLVIIGPFINLYSLLYCKHWYYMRNLQFRQLCGINIVQTTVWLINMYSIFLFKIQSSIADYISIYVLLVTVVLRLTSISNKYCTYSANQMNQVREIFLEGHEITKELMMAGWARQKGSMIREEILNSAKRLEIDLSTFYLGFMTSLEKSTHTYKKMIKIHEEQLVERKQTSLLLSFPHKDSKALNPNSNLFDASIILQYLITSYNKIYYKNYYPDIFIVVVSLITGFMDGFVRLYFNQTFHGTKFYEIPFFYLRSFFNSFFMVIILKFVHQYVKDINRINYVQEQLGQMLSPKKLKVYSSQKVLPSINFLCQDSLHCWISLRKCSSYYGLKFLKRHELFLPALILFAVIEILFVLEFKVFRQTSIQTNIEIEKLIVVCGFHSSFLFVLIFRLLYTSAAINEHFIVHKQIIQSNIQLIRDLNNNRWIYFNYGNSRNKDIEHIKNRPPNSQLHRLLVASIKMKLGENCSEENLTELFGKCTTQCEEILTRLEDQDTYEAFKLLSIKMDRSRVINIFIFVVSLGLSVVEYLRQSQEDN